MDLADIYVRDGRFEEARRLLKTKVVDDYPYCDSLSVESLSNRAFLSYLFNDDDLARLSSPSSQSFLVEMLSQMVIRQTNRPPIEVGIDFIRQFFGIAGAVFFYEDSDLSLGWIVSDLLRLTQTDLKEEAQAYLRTMLDCQMDPNLEVYGTEAWETILGAAVRYRVTWFVNALVRHEEFVARPELLSSLTRQDFGEARRVVRKLLIAGN
jgi:hypothetical protein